MAIDDPRTPEAPHSHWKPRGLVGNSDTMAFHDSKPSQRTDLTALSDRRDAGICRAVTSSQRKAYAEVPCSRVMSAASNGRNRSLATE